MLQQSLEVRVKWARSQADAALRPRIEAELRSLAWTLSQMEALVHDAHRVASFDHAYLLPRIDLRIPLFDVGRRFRVSLSYVHEKPRITLLDERDEKVADIIVCG